MEKTYKYELYCVKFLEIFYFIFCQKPWMEKAAIAA